MTPGKALLMEVLLIIAIAFGLVQYCNHLISLPTQNGSRHETYSTGQDGPESEASQREDSLVDCSKGER